jgi:hypothetical protein
VNITLDIKCPELAQAINNLAAAMSIRAVGDELRDVVKPTEKPFLGAVKAVSPPKVKAEPVVEPVAEPVAEPKAEAAAAAAAELETATAVDYAQVKTAVMAVSKAKGREAAVELLGEFEAKVGGDLTEDQWGPFLARAAEVLA